MKRHCFYWIVFLLILLAAGSLAACGLLESAPDSTPRPPATLTSTATTRPSPAPSPAPAGLRGTVYLLHSWGENELPVLMQIKADFRELYPDVSFDFLYVPIEDLQARFEAEARRGGGPNILLGPAEWGPALYGAGAIMDLSDLAAQTLQQTLNQPALGAALYQKALIGLPYSIRGVVLYRNKNIITRRADTFEELVSLAQYATQGEQVGAVLERSFFYSGAHLQGIGGRLMDASAYPAFDDPQGLAWLELLRAFELAGPPNYFSGEDLEYFMSGRVGWIIDGTWNMLMLAEAIGASNLVIDPWPAYDSPAASGYLSGYVQAENIYLNANLAGASADHLQANWAFIEFFLSPQSQIRLTEIGRIPAASGIQVVDITTGHLFNQAMTALAGGAAYPVIPEIDIYNIQLDVALKAYFNGAPAEEVLQAAAETIRRQVQALQATPTPKP